MSEVVGCHTALGIFVEYDNGCSPIQDRNITKSQKFNIHLLDIMETTKGPKFHPDQDVLDTPACISHQRTQLVSPTAV